MEAIFGIEYVVVMRKLSFRFNFYTRFIIIYRCIQTLSLTLVKTLRERKIEWDSWKRSIADSADTWRNLHMGKCNWYKDQCLCWPILIGGWQHHDARKHFYCKYCQHANHNNGEHGYSNIVKRLEWERIIVNELHWHGINDFFDLVRVHSALEWLVGVYSESTMLGFCHDGVSTHRPVSASRSARCCDQKGLRTADTSSPTKQSFFNKNRDHHLWRRRLPAVTLQG